MLTFDSAYKEALTWVEGAKGKKISLLLGNGFSMAYDRNRFSFTNLLDTARSIGIIPEGSPLSRLFTNLQTADFEKVIKTLTEGKIVAQSYMAPFNTTQIDDDIVALKEHLVTTITNNHPELPNEIKEEQLTSCSEFLNKFDKIYSLNYDLLVYWVIMQRNLLKFVDGFGTDVDDVDAEHVVYVGSTHNLFYLHGALHLFDVGTETIKLTYSRTNTRLKEQVQQHLKEDIFPVFISEGTHDEKLTKIRHNYYLNSCYKSLKRQSGVLFIFGTALKSNDEHIRKAIVEGKFERVYIGVWSEEDTRAAELLKVDIESDEKRPGRIVTLFDSKTVNPWGI